MDQHKFISAIVQIVFSLALVGIAIYQAVIKEYTYFALFLGVGVIFLVLAARTVYKWYKAKKDEDKKNK